MAGAAGAGVRPGDRHRHSDRPHRRHERRRLAWSDGDAEESGGAGPIHGGDRCAGAVSRRQPAAGDVRGAGGAPGISDRRAEGRGAGGDDFVRRLHIVGWRNDGNRERVCRDADRRFRAGRAVGEHEQRGADVAAHQHAAPISRRLGSGAWRVRTARPGGHQSQRQFPRHVGEQHEARWHGRHRSVRRRRLLGELQLRRDSGYPDQDARRGSRGRRAHRRVHVDRDQERRQRCARLGGVLRGAAEVQQLERVRRAAQPAQRLPARSDAWRSNRERIASGSSDRIAAWPKIRR